MGKQEIGAYRNLLVGAFTMTTAWLGNLAIPVYVLVGLNIVDYITGLVAAPYRGQERQSSRGFSGILKKICMWLLVGIGSAMDWLLGYACQNLGLQIPLSNIVAIAVSVWLLCNEMISILENIDDIGVDLPPFLKPLVVWLRETTGKYGQKNLDEEA